MIKIKILKEREKLKGGQGDNRPDTDFDPKQLAIGVEDETGEHTPSKEVGKEIAKDHLTKDPNYYRKLKAAGIDEKRSLKELLGALTDPVGTLGTGLSDFAKAGEEKLSSWLDKKLGVGDQTPQTAGHGYAKDYLGRLASSMTPAEILKKVLTVLEHEKIQDENNKKAVKVAVEQLLKKETAEDADYQTLTAKLTPLLTQDPKNPKAVGQRLNKAIEILKDYFGRKETDNNQAQQSGSVAQATADDAQMSMFGKDMNVAVQDRQMSMVDASGKAIDARDPRVDIGAMKAGFFVNYLFQADEETLNKIIQDPQKPQNPKLKDSISAFKKAISDAKNGLSKKIANDIINKANEYLGGKPQDKITLQEEALTGLERAKEIARRANTKEKNVWVVLSVLYYSGKLSKKYAISMGFEKSPEAQATIKEYLKLHEENKKAAVMLSELIKQLETNKDKVWLFFDTETAGMDPHERQLTEIAGIAVKPDFSNGNAKIISQYHKKIELTPETKKQIEQPFTPDPKQPNVKSVKDILQMTKYHTSKGEKTEEALAIKGFVDFVKENEKEGQVILVAHNANFDRKFVSVRSNLYGIEKLNNKTIDTLELVYEFFYPLLIVADKENLMSKMKTAKGMPSFTLGTLTAALKIENKDWHNALADVNSLIGVTQEIVNYLKKQKDIDVRAGYEKSLKLQRARKAWGKKKK